MRRLSRAWPLALIAVAALGAWMAGLHHLVSPAMLAARTADIQAFATAHPFAAALLYVVVYTGVVAASIPVGAALSPLGGALFGPVLGCVLAAGAATAGAVILFLVARGTLGASLARRHSELIARLKPRLERDGFSGLLALRLIPVVPFWLTNLAAGAVGMRLLDYTAATAIGVVPVTAVFTTAGAGFRDALASGAPPSPALILRPAILLPLLGLALLALLPMLVRELRRG
jgi:uncharacterized membrane protein YdjX (TVP38/TMEM64 family)